MTKQERNADIRDRLSAAVAERTIQPKGSKAYYELTEIIKDIRREYQNGSKSRIVIRYDATLHKYYGVDVR